MHVRGDGFSFHLRIVFIFKTGMQH